MVKLARKNMFVEELKIVFAKSGTRVYFEEQILALSLVFLFHQTRNLSRNKFAHFARQVESFFISYFAAFTKGN